MRLDASQVGIIVLAVALAAGLTAYQLQGRGSAPVENATIEGGAAWKLGQRYDYALDVGAEGNFQLDMGVGGKGQQQPVQTPFNYRLSAARLTVYPLEVTTGGARLALSITAPKVEFLFGVTNTAFLDTLKASLARPVEVVLDRSGKIDAYRFAPGTHEVARNLVREIAAQLVPPAASGRLEERALAGRIASIVTSTPGSARVTIRKTYEKLTLRQSTQYTGTITGEAVYVIDADEHQLTSVEVHRKITVMNATTVASSEDLTARFELIGMEAEAVPLALLAALKSNTARSSRDGAEAYADAERKLLEKLVAGTTVEEQLAAQFAQGAGSDVASNHQAFQKLLAFLRLRPELLSDFGSRLDAYQGRDGRFDMLATLIAVDGSEEGQRLLVDKLNSSWSDAAKARQLMRNLALLAEPSDATADALLAIARNLQPDAPLRGTVLSTLGGIGHNSKNPEKRAQIFGVLKSSAEGAKGRRELVESHVALGNLGHDGNVPYAQALLRHADPIMRQHGLESLRRVDGSAAAEATALLAESARTDPEVAVRRDAAKHMVGRAITTEELRAISARFYQERDVAVVQSYLDAIDGSGADRPAIKAMLQDLHAKCGTPKVCSKIEALILRNS